MIASEVKRLRIKKKLSQEKLARLSDISYNTIVKIETGSTPNPGIKTISKIAKALGVTVDKLISE
jgi:transcriptional regulator with XRE-family HTH domain